MNRKKIFLPQCKLFAVDDLTWALLSLGHDCVLSETEVDFLRYQEEEKNQILEELQRDNYDCAFSRNFSATLARACYERQIPYIAWTFDTPLQALYLPEAGFETNWIISFDQEMMRQLEGKQIPHMLWGPLASNLDRYSSLEITEEDAVQYACQVSMVANLYEHNIYEKIIKLYGSDKCKSEVEAWLLQQTGTWREEAPIHDQISDDSIGEMQQLNRVDAEKQLGIDNRFYMENQLARALTHCDRMSVLKRVAKQYQMVLYTGSDTSGLIGVECHGRISFEEEAPKVYHLSKINLNVTLRSIESGVPQRIFDIMAVGGFVMTNDQPEIRALFDVDQEIVVFRDEEEMMELIEYYLTHEAERIRIAMNGYRKVVEQYQYKEVAQAILQTVLAEI